MNECERSIDVAITHVSDLSVLTGPSTDYRTDEYELLKVTPIVIGSNATESLLLSAKTG